MGVGARNGLSTGSAKATCSQLQCCDAAGRRLSACGKPWSNCCMTTGWTSSSQATSMHMRSECLVQQPIQIWKLCRCSGFERRSAKAAPCSAGTDLISQLGSLAAAHQPRLQLHPGPVRHCSHHGEGAQTAPMLPSRSAASAPLKRSLLSRHLFSMRGWPASFAPRPAMRCRLTAKSVIWLMITYACMTCLYDMLARLPKSRQQNH